jgi:alanyl aminopeptidase
VIFLFVFVLCNGGSVAAATPDPTPPTLRLGDAARPTHYAVELTIVPTEDTFAGTMHIDLELRQATALIWLNASELTIQDARLDAGGQSVPARTVPGDTDFLGFAFERPVGPGPAKLYINYQGKLSLKDSRGLFKQKEGGDWYAFTHFEPIDARWAFPCFDEPAFKVPWQVTLRVKKEHVALSNTPVLSESDGPNGMKVVTFAETKPLPSHLIALAVGPFDIVEAGKAGKKGTPVRIIAPRGKAGEARYAAQVTPEALARLEDYFGTPYPYEKLDHIAVPEGGGAMENPGLITFSQWIILAKPEDETINFKRGYTSVCTHELAHQWFGNLVTMAWWDDIWLNESFATWMAAKIVGQWKPEWDGQVSQVSGRSSAMNGDTLVTARRIRQPIESKNDIANAFDGITYGKGAAVLSMFEAWIGESAFRKGIQRHLAEHAWGNATAKDFLAAISAEAGRDVAPAFSTFLDQAGVPLVSVELRCDEGAPPRLALTQKRYLPAGSQGSSEQTWRIPICVKYGVGTTEGRQCTLMTSARAELPLESARSCPAWVLPNEREVGYYRVHYRGDLLSRLFEDGGERLTLPERVGILGDVNALVRTGELSEGDALALAPPLVKDPNLHIISNTVALVMTIRDIVPDELRPNYARFIRKMYGEQAQKLGWRAMPNEDDNTRLLRLTLLGFVAGDGEDRRLIAEARKLARQWLYTRQGIDADMIGAVLGTAARNGDRALFDRLHAAAKKASDRRERGRLLNAMGSFRDVDIVKTALSILLTDEFDARESMGLVWGALADRKTRVVVYDFIKQNFDALVAKLPRDAGAGFPFIGASFCDDEHRVDVEAFFKDRSTKFTGGPRMLAQALERMSLCIAFKRAQQPSVAAFLKKY